ncbi:MAG: ATP-binding protein [Candidatus Acidiferrales bacterium]
MNKNAQLALLRMQVALAQPFRWLANRQSLPANLRLRTKFLLSLVLVIAALASSTLLIVGHAAEGQVQKGVEQDTLNSVLTFQNLRAERQMELMREAELFATLPTVKALMASEDAADVQAASEEVWRSGDVDLFALSDSIGKIVALHTTTPGFSTIASAELFSRSQGVGESGGWWFGRGHLYQVAIRPINLGSRKDSLHLGTVIIGREIDSQLAREVGRIALCQVAFRYGDEPVVSSFSPLDEGLVSGELSPATRLARVTIDDKRYFVATVDLTPGLRPALTLTVLKPYDQAFTSIARLNRSLILLGFVAVFVGAALVFLISRTFTRPLERLVEGVHALERGNFSYPLSPDTGDEVSQVTAAFDRMRTTLRQNQEQNRILGDQLRQAQKMEAVGRLAGGVAHDFNNLLTVIKGHGDLLELKLGTHSSVQHSVTQVQNAADRASALTRQLLAFSRMQVLQPQILDLNSLIVNLNRMLPTLLGEEIEYKFLPGSQLAPVKADPSQLEQVIMNLAVNARDSMASGGKLSIQTKNVFLDEDYARSHPPSVPGHYVLILVIDTGHGMDEHTKAKIFEPFFTTKDAGKGTGLGLATVYGIVKQSGGYIWVESAPGQGTRFEVYLPQTAGVASALSASSKPSHCDRGRGTVLLAEDEDAVRELAKKHKNSIDFLVTDVVMPRMRGTELALRLKRAHPHIKILYMSGYLEHGSDKDFVRNAGQLQKPFSRETFLQKLNAVANQDASRQLQPV